MILRFRCTHPTSKPPRSLRRPLRGGFVHPGHGARGGDPDRPSWLTRCLDDLDGSDGNPSRRHRERLQVNVREEELAAGTGDRVEIVLRRRRRGERRRRPAIAWSSSHIQSRDRSPRARARVGFQSRRDDDRATPQRDRFAEPRRTPRTANRRRADCARALGWSRTPRRPKSAISARRTASFLAATARA